MAHLTRALSLVQADAYDELASLFRKSHDLIMREATWDSLFECAAVTNFICVFFSLNSALRNCLSFVRIKNKGIGKYYEPRVSTSEHRRGFIPPYYLTLAPRYLTNILFVKEGGSDVEFLLQVPRRRFAVAGGQALRVGAAAAQLEALEVCLVFICIL